MFLTRLVYTSTITKDFSAEDIEKILLTARENNTSNSVTGMLCFNSKYFLQCLEGGRSNVNKTYHKILNDKRHSDIIMLDYKEICMRDFDEWAMGYIPESKLTRPVNIKYSGTPNFNPYEMLGESAYKMMLSLRDIVPTI